MPPGPLPCLDASGQRQEGGGDEGDAAGERAGEREAARAAEPGEVSPGELWPNRCRLRPSRSVTLGRESHSCSLVPHLCEHKDPFSPSCCYVILSLLAHCLCRDGSDLKRCPLPSVLVAQWLCQSWAWCRCAGLKPAQGRVQSAAAQWVPGLPMTVQGGSSESLLLG